MIILKYYSVVFIIFDLIVVMYTCGKEEDVLKLIIGIVCLVPLLIYLILS